jgi:hypothetical protein
VQSSTIDEDGYYKVYNLPPGEAKITISPAAETNVPLGPPMVGPGGERIKGDPKLTPEASAGKKGAKVPSTPATAPKKTSSAKHIQIPDDCRDRERTPLSYKVKSGQNKYDIDIPTK